MAPGQDGLGRLSLQEYELVRGEVSEKNPAAGLDSSVCPILSSEEIRGQRRPSGSQGL